MAKFLKIIIFFCFFILFFIKENFAQNELIKIVSPKAKSATVNAAKQFITGTTCKDCIITIAGKNIKVYKTGVFVFPLSLNLGITTVDVTATNNKKTEKQTIIFNYQLPKPIKETDSFYIEKIDIEPSGDVALMEGEYLKILVKAKPNCTVIMNDKYTLTELPKNQTKGIGGYYQYQYKIKEADNLLLSKFRFDLKNGKDIVNTITDNNTYTLFKDEEPVIGNIRLANAPVYTGLGEDRLGGMKAGFLDSGVTVQIIGRINNLYKIKMHNSLSVYIPKEYIYLLPAGNLIPKSLSSTISVKGDSLFDYVRVNLNTKLPYLTTPNTNPNQIVVDIFGASNNTNWMMQYPETLKEITAVEVNQIRDDQLRLTINLEHKQLWGYQLYYENNVLVVKVRRQKNDLRLANMVIGVDPGHGGNNDGALGIAGTYEKTFTLLIAKELRNLLEKEGATVIMSREADISFENQERLKMYRKKMPDFVISIHLNSAGDPLRVKGVSTYYKFNAFKNLSGSIYNRLLETGLTNWGHIGNFNFFMNSTTEFPNALVECLFISNPEDEENVFDPAFRTLLNKKIVTGIQDWLELCAKNK